MSKKKQDLDVLDEALSSTYLRNAECRIEPKNGPSYYLYLREDKSSFISLVEPEYWDTKRFKLKFITKVVYNGASWREATL